ncbi:MAG: 3',5'-cyclic-nucleotide phosphodiesterase [Deltaproteobacteria bacterium]|nr:3',5'-cyclic-nucleotide phosphodiesterase [Deltaproteobacteria bacterium]
MRIKVLGCYGTEFLQFKSCGFLVDGSVMLDAGTIVSTLTLEEQRGIRDVFITHAHLDHIKDIFFLANNLFEDGGQGLTIYSTKEILQTLQQHFINGIICPDFTAIQQQDAYVLGFETMREGKFYPLDHGISIRAEKVDHNIEAVGYIIRSDYGHIVYTGDTGPTDHIWEVCNTLDKVLAVFIECSFPNELQELANLCGHLTPQTMTLELQKLKEQNCPVFIFHMKPQYLKTIQEEIDALGDKRISMLTENEVITL